jgi:ATP-binding cassette subfamily B protein
VSAVGVLILLTAGLGMVNPVLIKFVFDNALFAEGRGPDIQLLWIIAGVMAAIAVGNGITGVIQTYMTNKVEQNVTRDLPDAGYAHLQGMSLNFFTGTRTGEIQSRVSNDVSGIQSVVTNTLTDTIANVVIFGNTIIAMLIL